MKGFRILLLALAVLFAAGCHEKGEPVPDDVLHYGHHRHFELEHELKELKERAILCVLKDSKGNLFTREATVEFDNGKAMLSFKYGVMEGKYHLLRVEFASSNPNDRDGKESIGVGRYLEASENGIAVTGSYSTEFMFGGSGTAEDPYQINSSKDLYMLQGYTNSDNDAYSFEGKYFIQNDDIDLWDYSFYINFEYGWLPIGKSPTNAFKGYYDGNNKKVSGLFISRKEQSAVGLFGVLYNAVVTNLELADSEIEGDASVGGIAGSVVEDGDNVIYTSKIENCKVTGSTITGTVGVGGIVGMVDVNTRLLVDGCETDAATNVKCSHYGAGGIVGAGVTYSSVVVTNSKNYAHIDGCLVDMGGIIGGADTLYVVSCENYGQVSGSVSNQQVLGAGGIAGGCGPALFIDVHNHGRVTAYKGAGGILGSTLVTSDEDGSNAVYNSVFICGSHNEGIISGEKMIGGLCGEAQLAVLQCYNNGRVNGTGSYVGGILGTTSVAAIHNAANFGLVSGASIVGGIAGKVMEGSYALNLNFGNITAGEDHVGGIIGKAGNQSMLHYCGNYGTVRLERSGKIGGIVGEIGDVREWNGWDIADVVVGTIEMVSGVLGVVTLCLEQAGAIGLEIIKIPHTIGDIALMFADVVSLGYGCNLLNFPPTFDPSQRARELANMLMESNQVHYQKMESLVSSSIKAASFSASDLNLALYPMDSLVANRNSVWDFYSASSSNHIYFNDKINATMAQRYQEVAENKRSEDKAHTIVQGVCLACGVTAMVLSFVPGIGPFAAAAGVLISAVGGANAVSKAVRNFESNTVEISQCFNFGDLECGTYSAMGGIAGQINDFTMLTDCLNGGSYPDYDGFAIVETAGGKATIQNTLDLAGKGMRGVFNNYSDFENYYSNNKILCADKQESDLDDMLPLTGYAKYGLEGKEDVLVPSTLCKISSYEGWDFTDRKIWIMPSPDKNGSYPVPYKSKMTK